MPGPRNQALLSLRAALIFVLSLIAAAVAGGLTYLSTHRVPDALIAAGVAAGGALALFSTIIE
ncbi:hypothetical protein [Streptomyces sp. NPDC001903]|uniref:hypothetical protein n=1 Tax=Streptomyces sp. NPDC001903 TaxID=3364622 RepID=UPI003681F80A